MFTGIVSDIGTIATVETVEDTRIVIRTAYDPESIDLGASISCSGVECTWISPASSASIRSVTGSPTLALTRSPLGVTLPPLMVMSIVVPVAFVLGLGLELLGLSEASALCECSE